MLWLIGNYQALITCAKCGALFDLEHCIAKSGHTSFRHLQLTPLIFAWIQSFTQPVTFGTEGAITHIRNRQPKLSDSNYVRLGSGVYMFEGKNNNMLDSISFRLALTVAILALWSGAGYWLLSV